MAQVVAMWVVKNNCLPTQALPSGETHTSDAAASATAAAPEQAVAEVLLLYDWYHDGWWLLGSF